ncbi:TPA: DUF1382 family protein [Escherichia coli]
MSGKTLTKASPVELRQCLEIANQLARSGIRFVPIPITADAELHLFGEILSRKLDELEKLLEEADTSPTV